MDEAKRFALTLLYGPGGIDLTPEEHAALVAAKLTGEIRVGMHVRAHNGVEGVVQNTHAFEDDRDFFVYGKHGYGWFKACELTIL